MKLWLFVIVVATALIGCAGKRVSLEGTDRVAKEGVVSAWANWVKDKGDKFDIQFNIKNESEKPIIVMLNNIRCYRGSMIGNIKHTFFNTGERTIDFGAGELKTFNFVCRYGSDVKGDYKVVINNIRENPSGDGSSTGKVVLEKLEWTLQDTAK